LLESDFGMSENSPCSKLWEKIEEYQISLNYIDIDQTWEAYRPKDGEVAFASTPRKAILELVKKIEGKKH
jgi:hypothetical protein